MPGSAGQSFLRRLGGSGDAVGDACANAWSDVVEELLAEPNGKALAEAFLSIRRRSVRKGLADLAREIAANDDPSPNSKGRSKPE